MLDKYPVGYQKEWVLQADNEIVAVVKVNEEKLSPLLELCKKAIKEHFCIEKVKSIILTSENLKECFVLGELKFKDSSYVESVEFKLTPTFIYES